MERVTDDVSMVEPTRRGRRRLDAVAFPLAAWCVWRLAHATAFTALGGYPRTRRANWDAGQYLDILETGYQAMGPRGVSDRTNFFPLVPWTTWVVERVVGSLDLAVDIVTNVSSLAAVVLVHAVARRSVGERAAAAAVVLLLAFPSSLFLWWFYSEAAFIALSAGTLFALQTERRVLAAVLAALTAMTRPFGFLIGLVVLVHEGHRRDRPTLAAVALALSPLIGLLVVCAVQWRQAGDPLAFLESGRARIQDSWGGADVYPFKGIVDGTRLLAMGWPTRQLGLPVDYVALLVFALLLPSLAFSRLSPEERWWGVLTITAPLLSGVLFSGGRYMLAAWPMFSLLGSWMARRRWVLACVLVVFVLLTAERFAVWDDSRFIG